MKLSRLFLLVAIVSGLALSGCSLKKNTAASRKYTAFITRYNIYFNGDEHYKKTIGELESKYEDDFTRTTLFMHPAEAYADEKAPQPSGDFKRSIEKAQKAIQVRSIKKRPARKAGKSSPEYKKWLKREEYNPFLHNAWLMMGRSQYMGGDFLGAAATFFYIEKHFWWLPATVTEAKLWQARSYIAIDWLFEAEGILRPITEKDLTDKTLVDLYNYDMADLNVRRKEYTAAIPYLEKVAKEAKSEQKARLTFLLGQLYALTGENAQAYKAFRKVGSMSAIPYRTRFNARIKQSEVFQGSDIAPEVKSLKGLTRYSANTQFLDQIYYAIGNLYLSRADSAHAIENYRMAIEKSTRNGIESALANLALGSLYYARGEYDLAQPCYSAAISQIPENRPDYATIKRRSDVLDELAIYSQNVTLQDSLLRLAEMTPEQQRQVVDRIIEDLKKREKEEAENAAREEYLAQQAAAGTGLNQSGASAPNTFLLNTDKSWYFYNQATRNAGRTEFQKRWGSRKLEDDWRRRNKASFSRFEEPIEDPAGETGLPADSIVEETPDEAASREALERASDPHFPEYYLRQIPSDDAEKATANEVIQEGLYNMGVILKDRMQDYNASEKAFLSLISRYPDNIYRLDAYYNLYLMFMLSDQQAKASTYRQLILDEFPESTYGQALADPDYMDKLRRMTEEEASLYDKAYTAYFNNDNATLHQICALVRKEYPMSRIMPKFLFLDALGYVTDNNSERFSETLNELVSRFPDTDVAPLASSYLRLLAEGRRFNSSSSNVRGMIWSTRLGNDSTHVSLENKPAEFSFRTDTAQIMLLIYPVATTDSHALLFDVARHNFTTYSVRDFDLESLQFGPIGLIVISGFNNRREIDTYRSGLESSPVFTLPSGVIPLIIARGDYDILINEGRSLEEYFDAAGDDRLKRIHESVLPSDEYDEPVIPELEPAPDSVPALPGIPEQPAPKKTPDDTTTVRETEKPVSPPSVPAKPAKPVKPATPTPPPATPEIPVGSEGDDPLFE